MNEISKEFVKKALEKGDFTLYSQPDSSGAKWWSRFHRIRDNEGRKVAFVQCNQCLTLLAYDSKKTGTSSLSTHAQSCRATRPNNNHNIVKMFSRPSTSTVSADMKRLVAESIAEMCAKDIRPFEIVSGPGFESFCQTLLDIGRKNQDFINAQSLLPDPTTVSRRLQSIAESKRIHTQAFDCL